MASNVDTPPSAMKKKHYLSRVLPLKGQMTVMVFGTGEGYANSQFEGNTVKEMVTEMRAVKPAREPKRELQPQPQLEITIGG